MKVKQLCCVLMVAALPFVACERDDNASGTNHSGTATNDNNGGNGNNGNGNTNLYFHFSSTGTNLDYPAGTTSIYFESNTEWSVTLDKSHFGASASVSPTSGNGRGCVTVSYGEESDHYDCSDYLYVKFRYVDKIYSDGSKHYDVNTYTITRRYHRTRL